MSDNNIFLLNISDLCEHQRASYYSFLSDGISKELKELENPFVDLIYPALGIPKPNEIEHINISGKNLFNNEQYTVIDPDFFTIFDLSTKSKKNTSILKDNLKNDHKILNKKIDKKKVQNKNPINKFEKYSKLLTVNKMFFKNEYIFDEIENIKKIVNQLNTIQELLFKNLSKAPYQKIEDFKFNIIKKIFRLELIEALVMIIDQFDINLNFKSNDNINDFSEIIRQYFEEYCKEIHINKYRDTKKDFLIFKDMLEYFKKKEISNINKAEYICSLDELIEQYFENIFFHELFSFYKKGKLLLKSYESIRFYIQYKHKLTEFKKNLDYLYVNFLNLKKSSKNLFGYCEDTSIEILSIHLTKFQYNNIFCISTLYGLINLIDKIKTLTYINLKDQAIYINLTNSKIRESLRQIITLYPTLFSDFIFKKREYENYEQLKNFHDFDYPINNIMNLDYQIQNQDENYIYKNYHTQKIYDESNKTYYKKSKFNKNERFLKNEESQNYKNSLLLKERVFDFGWYHILKVIICKNLNPYKFNDFSYKLYFNETRSIINFSYADIILATNQIMVVNPKNPYLDYLHANKSYTIQLHLKSLINNNLIFAQDIIGFIHYFKKIDDNFYKTIFNKISNKFDIYFYDEKIKFSIPLFAENYIFLGEIPFITDEGTFLVTGIERTIVSQIIRSPGVYFQRAISENFGVYYIANIISSKQIWTQLHLLTVEQILDEFDFREPDIELSLDNRSYKGLLSSIGFNITNYSKDRIIVDIPFSEDDSINLDKFLLLYDFLRMFGITRKEIMDSLKYPNDFQNYDFDDDIIKKLIFDKIGNMRKDILPFYMKFSSTCSPAFEIGESGRLRLNQKFGFKYPLTTSYITSSDLIAIIDGLNYLKYHDGLPDDIDHIKNKIVRSIGELIQLQLELSFETIRANFSRERNNGLTNKYTLYIGLIENIYKNEQSLFDPKVFTTLVKKFFKTSPLSHYMDQINPLAELANKRKISAFGPDGLNREHISTKIRDIHPSQYGRICPIETPEGQQVGLVSSLSLFGRIDQNGLIKTPYFHLLNGSVNKNRPPIYLTPQEETTLALGYSDVTIDNKNIIQSDYLSVKQNYSFLLKPIKHTKFLFTSPLQIFSVLLSIIPFMEHNDGNRALMGANMQRQSVPLLFPQKPIVGTGFESAIILDAKAMLKSISQGEVLNVSSIFIELQESFTQQKYCYRLIKYLSSNQQTSVNQKPIVWPGEQVYSGQLIADGPSCLDGELSLGRNLLVGYMPWEGYNFEDAIIMNEDLLFTDALTSIHITTIIFELQENGIDHTDYLTKRRIFVGYTYKKRNLDKNAIAQIGSYLRLNDVICGSIYYPISKDITLTESLAEAFEKILKIYDRSTLSFRNSSCILNNIHDQGRLIDIRYNYTPKNEWFANMGSFKATTYVFFSIAQTRKIEVGDKLSGRHGNKGVISKILPSYDMPYLPDGKPLDLILNPLGVPSRMNVGQLFECLLGFAGEILGKRFKVLPFDEIYGQEASRTLVDKKMIEARFRSKKKWVYDCENNFYRGKIFLRDGRTGEYFDNPITVGRSYILKLIHLVEDKIHGRSVGPYSQITEQPLSGKSSNGGQRFGEMEVWALEAHGCSTVLQELFTLKSDDQSGRDDLMDHLIAKPEKQNPLISISDGFLLLIRELNSLGFDFTFRSFRDENSRTKRGFKMENVKIFSLIEERLKLKNYLDQKSWDLLFAKNRLEEITNNRIFKKEKK